MLTTLLLATLGQFQACNLAATTYRQQSVTYAAPTYYQQSYAAPYVEKTAFVYVQPYESYYASLVGSAVRDEMAVKAKQEQSAALSDRVNQLAAALDRLTAQIGGQPQPGVQPPVPDSGGDGAPPPPPVPAKPDPNPGVSVPPAPVQPGQTPPEVVAILTKSCVKCHQAPAKAGKGVVMFDEAGKLVPFSPLAKLLIVDQVLDGEMPKNADPLSFEETATLRAWLKADKDAIKTALSNQPKGN